MALFHGRAPTGLELAQAAHATWSVAVPSSGRCRSRRSLGAGNERLAAALALAGELCLLLEEPASRAQAFLGAARWAERSRLELAALGPRGEPVGVLPWLEPEPRRLVGELAAGGRCRVIEGMLARLDAAPVAAEA